LFFTVDIGNLSFYLLYRERTNEFDKENIMFKSFLLLTATTTFLTGLIGCSTPPPHPEANARAYITGKYLAKKYPGKKALLISTRWSMKNKRTARVVEGLEKALGKGNVKVDAIKIHAIGAAYAEREDLIRAKDFDALIAKHPDCDLIITMVGLPVDKVKMKNWNNPRKHIVMLNANIYRHEQAITSGRIVAAVAIKSGGKTPEFDSSNDPPPPEEIFTSRYILVTPQNIKKLKKQYPIYFR
jgi:hypothetical protein